MAGYKPVIPPEVAEVIRHLSPEVNAVKAAIRAIAANPAAGQPLQRELAGYWKFRVRRFRILYRVDRATKVLRITAVGERRSIYEEVADIIRSQ